MLFIFHMPWDHAKIYLIFSTFCLCIFSLGSSFLKRDKSQKLIGSFLVFYIAISVLAGIILHFFPFSPIAFLSGKEFLSLGMIALIMLGIINTIGYVNSREEKNWQLFAFPLVLSAIIALINDFPYYEKFPTPSGPYALGTQAYYFADSSRKEILTKDAHDIRELMLQFSYPSKRKENQLDHFYSCSRRILTNSREKAQILDSDEKFSLLIFSAGTGSNRFGNTQLIEELVSHGYFVVAIDHTYLVDTQFPDGRKIRAFDFDGDFSDLNREAYLEKISLGIRVKDIQFSLSQIKEMNKDPNSFFYQKLDTENIGVSGWSIGGAAAGKLCAEDKAFKAGVNLDGWDWMGLNDSIKFESPFLYVQSDREEVGWKELLVAGVKKEEFQKREKIQKQYEDKLMVNSDSGVFRIQIEGSMHSNFRDHGFLGLGQLGSRDAKEITEISNQYVLSFFNKYLKGNKEVLLEENWAKEEKIKFRRN